MARSRSALDAAARTRFIDTLAETANVSLSAKCAGISTFDVYRARKTSTVFRDQWQRALGEGYVRLEADLLAEALRPVANATSDKTAKQKAEKHRIAIFLLNAHRAAVRGEAKASAPAAAAKPNPAQLRADLEVRFAAMRARMTGDVADGDDSISAA